ncbi:MAG: response regulator transcription factor [Bacillota bacterium]|nr:response regulator transcription factor [Bacillota bacterium]
MEQAFKIMVIEDDISLRDSMLQLLNKYGYTGAAAEDFRNIEQEVERVRPDMLLLDINLPYFDGFYFVRLIRKKWKLPIIIISARNTSGDQILGMELGADDYLLKPFRPEILLTKVKVLLRRVYGELSKDSEALLTRGGLTLNETSFKAEYKNKSVLLTRNEFKILKRLIEARGVVVKREVLFTDLWDEREFVDENTLSVNVTRVKSKLEELGLENVIKTRRGFGYILELSE